MVAKARLIVQLTLGIVFLLSAGSKARDPRAFARGVAEYRVLPSSLAYLTGLILLPLEAFLSLSHLTGWLLELAVPLGLVTLLSFGFAAGVNLGRGRVLPCYCFGNRAEGGEMLSGRTMVRLLLLILAEAFLFVAAVRNDAHVAIVSSHLAGLFQFSLAFFWASFVILVASWLLSFTDLLELFGARRAWARRNAANNSRASLIQTDKQHNSSLVLKGPVNRR